MAIPFEDVLEARSDPEKLNEVSLARAYQHVQNSEGRQFGIVTSWRPPPSGATDLEVADLAKKNQQRFEKLRAELQSLGLGFIRLVGHWGEQQEPLLFVPGLGSNNAKRIRARYNQDAVVYSGPETNQHVVLLLRDDSVEDIGEFSPSTIAAAYSSLKGKPFRFRYVAQTWSQQLVAEQLGKPKAGVQFLVR